MPGELLGAVKAKSEGKAKLTGLPIGEASRPKEAKEEGVPISEEGESAASAAGTPALSGCPWVSAPLPARTNSESACPW